MVLNGAPVALPDASYFTAEDTALTITTSDTTLLDNDWDPEGDSLTASIVDSPSNGSVTGFSGSNGTFTYTPDTSFVGVDTFTYQLNDGTDYGNIVAVSIAVGGHLGPRTNLEARARAGSNLLTGDLEVAEPLTPGLFLLYDSGTLPEPIIVVETFLQDSSSVPDEITAELTFNYSTGTTYEFDTTGLSAGDSLRFALQYDATSLSTGRYDYSVDLTTDISSSLVSHIYDGYHDIVNRGGATHPFGRGWQLEGIDELVVETGGVLWVQSTGDALWFAEDGGGGFDPAEGDVTFSTLELDSGTYSLTDKHGIESTFNSSGQLTSREDRNGNTVGYTYTSGLLTKITDPFSRETTFTYTSGRLTSVTDFASRTATLAYDGSGRLASITQPDPDGGGALASPVTEFSYDATSHLLTTITNHLDDDTDFTYGSHHRLTAIAYPDSNSRQFKPMQTLGLPTGTSGNSLTAADPQGDTTNATVVSKFKTDRFGNVTYWSDPLDSETLTERNSHGQPVRITQEDPDGTGSLTSPVTVLGYDALGNLMYQRNPLGGTRTWSYESSFNLVEVATDELGNETSFDYDAYGNLTELTDAGSGVWTYTYDSGGRVTSATTPDPDGAAPAGPLSASVTEYDYDSYGRLDTITYDDQTTTSFEYDTADNLTDVTDELGHTTSYTYDALARLTSVTDRESATTTYAYDAIGQVATVTDALDNDTDYQYNSRGWLVGVTRPDPDGAGPLTAPESTYTYDARGNLTVVGEVWMDGSATLEYQYDAADRRTKMKSGTIGTDETDYVYDNLARLIKVTNPLDEETVYEYDAAGHLLRVIQNVEMMDPPEGPTVQYGYDAAGRLIQVTDARGYETDYTYDERGLLTKVELPDPDGSGAMGRPTMIHAYDAIGRYTGFTDSWQRKTTYAYDSRDRVVSVTEPDPDGAGGQSASATSLGYDDAGRLISVTDPLSRVTAFEFDDEGRITTITLPDPDGGGSLASPEIAYAYNDLGLVTGITDPLGGVTSYEYDNLRRVTKITLPDPDATGPLSAPETSYAYSARGLLDTVTDPLGRETTFSYDDFGRRTGVADDAGNKTTYAYDVLDRITSITLEDPDGAGSLTASVTAYTYAINGRIATLTDPEGGVTRFTYDDAGNLLTVKDPVNNTTTYSYDGVGRVTMETNELDDARSFYYDSLGRTAKVLDRNERAVQFEYDAMDRPTHEKWYDDASPVPTITIATTTEGGLTDEVQRVGFSDDMGMLSSGTFTLTFDGHTTSGIAWDASAATVQSALEGLSNIDAGEVSVTKTTDWLDTQEWQITFAAGLAGTNVAQTTVDSSNVWGMGTITDIEATDTQGGSTNNEVQTVTLANEDDGVLRLAFQGETTAEIDFDATAAEVESALEDLNGIDNVTVSGSAGGPWTVTFVGMHAGVDQPRMNGDAAALLSGSEVRDISYTYDAASQLTEASDADSTYAYTYDYLGRVLTVDND
ncbi:MAG: cadherin-like domain-containing protein, partial [Pirellulaceae bacterium]|nr:cadherin-like domain-containing protein [Pirellulaceae bacterium]